MIVQPHGTLSFSNLCSDFATTLNLNYSSTLSINGCIFAIVLGCILTFLYTKKYTVTYNSVLTRSRSIGYFSVQGLALFIFGFGIGISTIPATCPTSDCINASKEPLLASAVLIGILFIYAIGNL